jgi:hypothetical protein
MYNAMATGLAPLPYLVMAQQVIHGNTVTDAQNEALSSAQSSLENIMIDWTPSESWTVIESSEVTEVSELTRSRG